MPEQTTPQTPDFYAFRMLNSVAILWLCLHPVALYAASLSVAPTIIDVTSLSAGESVQCVDLSIADVEFDLAAFEFKVEFPPNITSFSEVEADWTNGQGASIRTGAMFDSRQTQSLPAMMDGALTAATVVQNQTGFRPFGAVVIDRSDVPQGSGSDPNPGGQIARICFNVQNTPLCASKSETVNLRFGSTTVLASDPSGIGNPLPSQLLVLQNDNANYIKVDFNKDGVRNQLDALGASLCAINGKAGCGGWEAESDADFIQTFDFNCDGIVNSLDALPLARWALDVLRPGPASLTSLAPVTMDVSAFYNLVENWGTSLGDLDGDGVVTVLDLVMAVELPVELESFEIQ